MSNTNNKTPRYLLPTTSQLLHEQESLRRRRQYLEAEEAKRPVMRFGGEPAPAPRSFMPPPSPGPDSALSAGSRQTSQSAPAHGRDRGTEAPGPTLPPMRFSLASYHATPAPSPRADVSPSPTPRAVNTAASARPSTKGSRAAASLLPFRRLDSTDASLTDHAAAPRTWKRPRSASENDDPAQLLPDFPQRREPSSQKASRVPGSDDFPVDAPPVELSVSVEREATPVEPPASVSPPRPQANEVVAVKRSPSGFALPRSSEGVARRSYDEEALQALAHSALPTPARSSAPYTPLPAPHAAAEAPFADEFPTPTYVPRASLFASTPTPHKMASRDALPEPAERLVGQKPEEVVTEEVAAEEEYGSPAPTAEQVLESFAASEEKRCCHRPQRSKTPPQAVATTDAAEAMEAASRPGCGCPRRSPGSQSQKRSASHVSPRPNSSARAASPELTPKHVLSSVVVSTEKRRDSGRPARDTLDGPSTPTASLRTPSPVPTAQGVEASLLASAEKRCVSGSPTPASRTVTTPEAVAVQGVEQPDEAPVTPSAEHKEGKDPSATKSLSPQPTAEQLIDSLTMSAQKPAHRSKATSQENAPATVTLDGSTFGLGLAPPPDFVSAASPGLTPQNIEQSFACRRLDGTTRSGAPDPVHGSLQSSVRSPVERDAAHRSPSFDTTQVQASLEVIEEKLKNADRSLAETRESPADTDASLVTDRGAPPSVDFTATPTMHERRADEQQAEDVADEEAQQERAPFSHERAMDEDEENEDEDSTEDTGSNALLNEDEEADTHEIIEEGPSSDMFFDCYSAPPTAPPTPALPEAYLQLQRDIQAISQGRSASYSVSPRPADAETAVVPADPFLSAPRATSDKTRTPSLSSSSSSPARRSSGDVVAARGSVVLLSDSHSPRSLTPLARAASIQHPHQPFDERAAEAIAEAEVQQLRAALSVSRTPPPRPSRVPDGWSPIPSSSHATSPVPRPVTLRSQVRLPHVPTTATTASAAPALSQVASSRSPMAKSSDPFTHQRGSPSAEPPTPAAQNTSDIIETSEEPRTSPRAIASMEQWRHNVRDDDQIFAVSPSGRVAVSVRYERGTSSVAPAPLVEGTSLPRTLESPNDAPAPMSDPPTTATGEPAPRVSQGSARSSRGSRGSGRKSQVEQLLDMLPASVAAEIVSSTTAPRDAPPSEEPSHASSPVRRSRASTRLSTAEGDADQGPAELVDTILERTSPAVKRPRKEPVAVTRSISNVSLSEVQVSPLSSASPPHSRLTPQQVARPGVTYSVVAGEVMAVSTDLTATLQQQLFDSAPHTQNDGDISPGTRKHLRHQKKMQKQRALKKANKADRQHSTAGPAAAAEVSPAHAGTPRPTASSPTSKKLKKGKKSKKAKKEEAVPPTRARASLAMNKKKAKKSKKLSKK